MNNNNLIYNLDSHIPFKHILIYGFQELLAVLVATILITSICGVPIGAGLIGAGLATITYNLITRGNSNVFISNSGAFVSPCLFAFAAGGGTAAMIGAFVIMIIYIIMGLIFSKIPMEKLYIYLPKTLIATITILIGLSLINYIPSYLGDSGFWGTIIALITAFTIGLTMHYGKGKLKTLPFLIGVTVGYLVSFVLTICNIASLIDFSVFSNLSFIQIPKFNFLNLTIINSNIIIPVIIIYTVYALSASCEVISDTQAMSVVINEDLFKRNGFKRIFIATGVANGISGLISGLGQTSYGEGTGCTAASRVASAKVTTMTAVFLILMGLCGPVQALLLSIPNVVFAGASIVLYPLIAIAGLKMLIHNQVDLDDTKNLLLVGVPLAIGLSGIAIGGTTFALSGVALALIAGVVLNLILKNKN